MKTSFFLIILLLHFHLVYPQDITTKSTYTLGNHGIEITLDAPWNFVKQTENWYEILYGCSGPEYCANIQVSFWYEDIGGTIEENHETVIKEYKRKYPDLIYTKGYKTINDFDFQIIDLYAVKNGYFFAQTVATAKITYEIVNFCYTTKKLKLYTEKNIDKYTVEKNRLFDVLNTIGVTEIQKAPETNSDMVLFSCDDHTTNLFTQEDSLKCCVQLPGKASLRIDGKFVKFDSTLVRSFLISTKPFLSNDSNFNSDEDILIRFMNAMSSLIYSYSVTSKSKKNNYFYFIPLDSLIQENAFMWYPFYITKREWENIFKSDQGNVPYEVAEYAEIFFVSLIIDDYIFSFQIHLKVNKSLDKVRSLLSEIVKSLKYTYDTLEPYDMCTQYLLKM